jgi:5-bromo-4-chloroindolyl phosphate hydrolysis protein
MDDNYYVVLARCFEAIVRKHEGVSDSEAAKLIQLEFSGFDHLSADALRRQLPEARKRIQRLRKEMAKPIPGLGQLAN